MKPREVKLQKWGERLADSRLGTAQVQRPQPGGTPPVSSVSRDVQDQRKGQGRWVTLSFSFLGFLSLQFIYYFVCECFDHMYAWCLWGSEEGVRSPGAAVRNGCEKSPPSSARTSLAHQPTHLLSFPFQTLTFVTSHQRLKSQAESVSTQPNG